MGVTGNGTFFLINLYLMIILFRGIASIGHARASNFSLKKV